MSATLRDQKSPVLPASRSRLSDLSHHSYTRTCPSMAMPSRYEAMSSDDFETASIRSAAPSYISEAPSYHTIPPNEHVPEYSARDVPPYTRREPPRYGLPPIPAQRPMPLPSLAAFSIPTWSTVRSNPTSRHYHNVAQRRMNAAVSSGRRQLALEGPSDTSDSTRSRSRSPPTTELAARTTTPTSQSAPAPLAQDGLRPLEDPYLVGETAAAQARAQRLAREQQEDVLVVEDRRWDWFLAHISDLESRERSWARFRQNFDNQQRRRRRLTRLGGLL